ncbi:MAG TPA: hypothetical protein VFF69_09545, partial [Phycisphaerales bacterium]|nr:hypothetical protein [Phycisphaerales bacterium]
MTQSAPHARRVLRLSFQGLGFVVGLLLLGWCVRAALSAENREQLAKLRDADPGQIGVLFALSAATLAINGLIFWATLRPVRKLRALDVLATNALCTFLAYLPFKLGAVTRVAIHNRRDRVPLLTIGAWFGAMLVVMLAAYVPATGASLWRRGVDAAWWITGLGGAAMLAALAVAGARPLAGERGVARLHRALGGARMPLLAALARSERFAQLHAGAAMLASPKAVAACTLLRLVDVGALAA